MRVFEDLGVAPEIAEALAAEGIESPTPLQETAIPVVRKGNNIVIESGPGSGLLVAWAAGLLDRIDATSDRPKVLIVCATVESADRQAESTARLAAGIEHRIAALGAGWALAERADVLFSTPDDALAALKAGTVSGESLQAIVLDQVQVVQELDGLDVFERIFEYLSSETQRILTALPVTPEVADLVTRHLRRAVTVPTPGSSPPRRGEVRFRIAPEPRETAVLRVVEELFGEGARHVLVYCRTDDRAADVGDILTLHGFAAGAPGDISLPVWLGVDALEARDAVGDAEGVVVVSCDVPADPDTLDRRHSLTAEGVVVVLPREVAHLKALGRRTGYKTVPFPPQSPPLDPLRRIRASISAAIESEDTAPYVLALEPLLEHHDAIEIAAAAVALLRRKPSALQASETALTSDRGRPTPGGSTPVPSWSKLFLSVGERDGLAKGDLLGAITGEAGVAGSAVGKIDIRESHTLVEVHDTVAQKVIRALNGTTIKGRAVRADFDRPRSKAPRRPRQHDR